MIGVPPPSNTPLDGSLASDALGILINLKWINSLLLSDRWKRGRSAFLVCPARLLQEPIRELELYSNISYLRYDPCLPTSTCSRRWPYKIPVHTLYSTVRCISSLAGINRCDNPSQRISKWSLVLQYTLEVEYLYLLLLEGLLG